jgi:16S rRNA (guanine527-N7)-methyltransferase
MDTPRRSAGDDGPGAQPGPSSPSPEYAPSDVPAADPPPPAPPVAGVLGIPPHLRAAAAAVFGDRLALAATYADLLATDGVVRGLIGPREAPRLWERHLLNCAVVAEAIPHGASVLDVGSGAGLPGIVLAVARPDLSIGLVEPLARRTTFLTEAVETLGLDAAVTVVRARAEEAVRTVDPADVVTARAVAPLDRLAGWCLPLTAVGGRLLALKGSSAADEVAQHRTAVADLGGGDPTVRLCGAGLIDPPTTVVEVVREHEVAPPARIGRLSSGRGQAGRGRTRRR